MKCKEVNRKLSKFIEDKLSQNDNIVIKTHIDNCKMCSSNYNNLVNTLNLLRPTKNIEEQAFYYTRLKQKMENKLELKTSIFDLILGKRIMQASLYLTSIVIAVFIGIQIGSYSNSNDQLSNLSEEEDYIQVFSETQYLNDFEQENLESTLVTYDDTIEE
jgi:ABC-type phosphate transport system permease subunit